MSCKIDLHLETELDGGFLKLDLVHPSEYDHNDDLADVTITITGSGGPPPKVIHMKGKDLKNFHRAITPFLKSYRELLDGLP